MSESFGSSSDRPRPSYGSDSDRPRPSYGLPGTTPQSGDASAGQASASPEYGQSPSARGSWGQPAAQYGKDPNGQYQSSPYQSSPYQSSQYQVAQPYGAQSHSGQPQGNPAFGGFGQDPQHSSAPAKKQKPVGIILTVLGALGIIASLIIAGVVGWRAFAGIIDFAKSTESSLTTPNSTLDGTTATKQVDLEEFSFVMAYVPEKDASKATCSVTKADGSTVTGSSSGNSDTDTITINGQPYVPYKDAWMNETGASKATVKCENVSAPVLVLGPWNIGAIFSSYLRPLLGAGLLFLLSFFLFVAGIITMLVRASKRRKMA